MDIEYAKIMTKSEVDSFYSFLKSKQGIEVDFDAYKSRIIEIHNRINKECESILNNRYEEHIEEVSNYNDYVNEVNLLIKNKKCLCGGNLRYISSYNFWGCLNYKDSSQHHFNFNGKDLPYFKEREYRNIEYFKYSILSNNWLKDILNELNVKSRPIRLYEYIMKIGLEDLKSKYNNLKSENVLTSLNNTKSRTKKEEIEIYDYFSMLGLKLNKQLPIKYKLKGQKEKKCFIDLVLSNEDYIFVVEIKTNSDSLNYEQLELYDSLIRFMENKKRYVKPIFVIYNSEKHHKHIYTSTSITELSFNYIKEHIKSIDDLFYETIDVGG